MRAQRARFSFKVSMKKYTVFLTLGIAFSVFLASVLFYAFVFHSTLKADGTDENAFLMQNVRSGGLTGYGSYEISLDKLTFESTKFLNLRFNAMQTMYADNFVLKLNIDDMDKFKKGMSTADSIDIFSGFMFNVDSGLVRSRIVNAVEMKKGFTLEISIDGQKRFLIATNKLLMKRGKPVQMAATVISDMQTGRTLGILGCSFDKGFSRVRFNDAVYLMTGDEKEPVDMKELILF